MAYFFHTGKDTSVRLSRVRHTVKLHGRVSPSVDIKMKSVCSTRPHTRACDQPCDTSQYTALNGTRPSTRVCFA
ncbi:Amiloride-sensitive cation channel 5 [Gossypium arboreum]|uniref:Amiloride-sensitive cation channel 5 n=1 Tax=Gossypium arboreum TaxID=29729 RepID=A0A0B0NZI5_GOSAR|nr:Amiloride-sensitive cation channel 5 [Gossypium arboreum]